MNIYVLLKELHSPVELFKLTGACIAAVVADAAAACSLSLGAGGSAAADL